MLSRLQKELIELSRTRPKYRGVLSTRADIIFIKQKYGLSDYELCEVLEDMQRQGLIKEFVFEYTERGIYKYWFK